MSEIIHGEKGQKTKQKLLLTGFNLFIKFGILEISLNDILQVCEVKKGNFYYYFDSKETFLQQSFEECYNKPLSKWFSEFIIKKGNYKELIEEYYISTTSTMQSILREYTSNQNLHIRDVLIAMHEGMNKYDFILNGYLDYENQIKNWISQLLLNEQKAGVISRQLDLDKFSDFINFSYQGLLHMWMIDKRIDFEKSMSDNFQFIWSNLKT